MEILHYDRALCQRLGTRQLKLTDEGVTIKRLANTGSWFKYYANEDGTKKIGKSSSEESM